MVSPSAPPGDDTADRAAVLFNRADLLMETRRWSAALAAYRTALSEYPDQVDAMAQMALCAFMDGQPELAYVVARHALAIDPNDVVALSAAVFLAVRGSTGNPLAGEAESLLRDLMAADPDGENRRPLIVSSLVALDHVAEAVEFADRNLRRLPGDQNALLCAAGAHAAVRRPWYRRPHHRRVASRLSSRRADGRPDRPHRPPGSGDPGCGLGAQHRSPGAPRGGRGGR